MSIKTALRPTEGSGQDRRMISVDGLPDQASIAAQLRRAFAAGDQRDSDREFADLLQRIH